MSRPRRSPLAAGLTAPADRRFRRPDVRPVRRRTAVLVVRWTLPLLACAAAAVWAGRAITQSELLVVRHVVISGNTRLSTGQVEGLLDGIRGENILQVDFDRYRRQVMDSPWVADVRLARVLPSTIDVRITERTPMAIARLNHQLFLVDDAGVIIDEYGAPYRDLDLPIVDGLLGAAAAEGPMADPARVRLADALLTSLDARRDLGRRVSHVDVSDAHDARVMFDSDPAWLHLGDDQFAERLHTYLELAPTLRERFRDIDYVDLRFDPRVFVHARGRTDGVDRAAR
jgi:cell division septal protein FtsQ